MPRSTAAAQEIVDEATVSPWIDLIAELADPLAEYILNDYGREDWQDSPLVQSLARVAALLEAQGRQVPPPILDALRAAAEAAQPVGVA